ncbi:MAG TPA: nucleotidyltransferase substrate binding protein [Bacillota bacterium]|nr:nucleotidyltransferase substrate binding protein [Bacillota bacterium]
MNQEKSLKEKLMEKLTNYQKAIRRLKEALERDESDELVLDGVIQRFEFTYELSWKLLKAYLTYHGIAEVRSPREAFKEGFAAGVIDEGDLWIEMLDDRNVTSHTYNETEAKEIFNKIKHKYYTILNRLCEVVEGEMAK